MGRCCVCWEIESVVVGFDKRIKTSVSTQKYIWRLEESVCSDSVCERKCRGGNGGKNGPGATLKREERQSKQKSVYRKTGRCA